MDRTKKALVRGRRAVFWLYKDDNLVLPHPRWGALEGTSVPVAHLADESEMAGHYARLADKTWVPRAAIDELIEIASGARE